MNQLMDQSVKWSIDGSNKTPFIPRGGEFIYGNQYKLYRMTHYHIMVIHFQKSSSQQHTIKTFMFVFILSFSSQNRYKVFDYLVPNQCKTHNFQPQDTSQNFYMA